jgi:hypothetical protein
MLTNLKLDGELDVIHTCPCEARFRRRFPIIRLVPHLFWRSSARVRTWVALGVGNSIKEECLSRMVFLGKAPLQHAVTQYMMHYHEERNHQGIDNRLPRPAGGSHSMPTR